MGEAAEDMLDGTCCSGCGCYFVVINEETGEEELYTHGFPVVCNSCYEDGWDNYSIQDENVETL